MGWACEHWDGVAERVVDVDGSSNLHLLLLVDDYQVNTTTTQ